MKSYRNPFPFTRKTTYPGSSLALALLLGVAAPPAAQADPASQAALATIDRAQNTLTQMVQLLDSIEQRKRGGTAATTYTPPPVADTPNTSKSAFVYVDLRAASNQQLNDNLDGVAGDDLHNVPRGEATLGTSQFQIADGIIHLRGASARRLPARAANIPVNTTFSSLHVLHSTGNNRGQNPVAAGTEIGAFVLHYADATTAKIPIRYGEDVNDWRSEDSPSRVQVKWTGTNTAVEKEGGHIHLFVTMWDNPYPDKQVTSLDYVSDNTTLDPFLVAMSLEKRPTTP